MVVKATSALSDGALTGPTLASTSLPAAAAEATAAAAAASVAPDEPVPDASSAAQLDDQEAEQQLQQLLENSRAAADGPADGDLNRTSDRELQEDSPRNTLDVSLYIGHSYLKTHKKTILIVSMQNT